MNTVMLGGMAWSILTLLPAEWDWAGAVGLLAGVPLLAAVPFLT